MGGAFAPAASATQGAASGYNAHPELGKFALLEGSDDELFDDGGDAARVGAGPDAAEAALQAELDAIQPKRQRGRQFARTNCGLHTGDPGHEAARKRESRARNANDALARAGRGSHEITAFFQPGAPELASSSSDSESDSEAESGTENAFAQPSGKRGRRCRRPMSSGTT